jgi:serine/threonine protein phosphatase PrpC
MGGNQAKEIQKATLDPSQVPSTEFRLNTAMRKSVVPSIEDLQKVAISPQVLSDSQLESRISSPLDYCVQEQWTLPTQSAAECKEVLAYIAEVMPDSKAFKENFYSKTTGFDEALLIKKTAATGAPKTKDRMKQTWRSTFPNLHEKLQGKKIVSIDALFAGFSMAGRKKSQDSTFIDYIVTPGGCTYLLIQDLDGHGEYGTEMSTFASSVIAGQLARLLPSGPPKSADKVFKAFKDAFKIVQNYLEREAFEKSALSGSTATCLLVSDSKIYCAYVGDSKSFVLKDDALQLMIRPHHFDEEPERVRALQEGRECSIRRVQIRPGVEAGPLRIFVKGTDSPGLAMSRSLGDCEAHRVGCSASPEFMEVDISECKSFQLMTGSDGLWDEIEPPEVLRLMYGYRFDKSLGDSVATLLQESCRRWAHKQVGIVDDISLVAVFFNLEDFGLGPEVKSNEPDEKKA